MNTHQGQCLLLFQDRGVTSTRLRCALGNSKSDLRLTQGYFRLACCLATFWLLLLSLYSLTNQGFCTKGYKCTDAHDESELRKPGDPIICNGYLNSDTAGEYEYKEKEKHNYIKRLRDLLKVAEIKLK